MEGLLAVNKPVGMSSFEVVKKVRRLLPRKTKIGHAGTLDPFADGVLVLMIGKATKSFDKIQTWNKTYRSVAKVGASSDTLDCTGKIELGSKNHELWAGNIQEVQKIADKYVGGIEQVVPSYAAAKYKGKKLYEYARAGVEVPEKKKKVTVYSIKVVRANNDEVEMLVGCSSGTYIRQLSYDIMKELEIESYLESLRREAIGEITLEICTKSDLIDSLDKVEQNLLRVPGE